jgi:putative nucleotidyltransferase with HDIG domain
MRRIAVSFVKSKELEGVHMKIFLPEKVNFIINKLKENGYEAYAVGGCVRDSVLGRVPDDWDITTSATPNETKALFRRTFDTGIEHGTITVLVDKEAFEVTTYRVDGEYEDSRHPREVVFTRSLKEDLLRRDFTINAMAYNKEEGLVDIFGGIEDLQRKMIRCVGNARERFGEDALRILRAVRFAAQLGFRIEDETMEGIRKLAPTLANISAERIQVELVKMLVSPNPGLLALSYELGITKVILPEFDEMMGTGQETPHHMYSVGMHTLKAVEQVRADKVLRLTMLLHDVAKPQMKTVDADGVAHFKMHDVKGAEVAKRILKRLKFDNDTLGKVTKLVQYHDYRMPAQPKNVRRAMNKIGEELFPYYLEIRKADTMAQSEYMREEKLSNIAGIERCYKEILKKKECVSLKMLAVSGSDLIADGMQPGKQIGAVLQALLELVIEQPEYNTKEILLEQSRKLRKETLL